MSATTAPLPRRPAGRAFGRLAVTELKLFLREKTGVFWGVVFPLVLLIIFGSIPSFRKPASELGGISYLTAYVPILIALVLALLAINALPAVLAGYREKGILRRLATTPIGPVRMLGAQLAVQATLTTVTVILLLAVARIAYHVPLPAQPGAFLLAMLLAAAALYALGLVVAAVVPSSRAAQPIGALLFFPMMFFAGLWLPIAAMPSVLQHISHLTPLGAAVQALGDASARQWPHPLNLAVLAGYAVVLNAAAVKLFRWE